jgi:hypothetical protein
MLHNSDLLADSQTQISAGFYGVGLRGMLADWLSKGKSFLDADLSSIAQRRRIVDCRSVTVTTLILDSYLQKGIIKLLLAGGKRQ